MGRQKGSTARPSPPRGENCVLNGKEEAFCLAYVANGGSAKDAYVTAYGGARDNANSHRLMRNDGVVARIRELRDAAAAKAVTTEARLLREVGRLAYSNVAAMLDEHGDLLPIKDMPEDVQAAIASIAIERRRLEGRVTKRIKRTVHTVRIWLWNKGDAQEKLMKHQGLYEKDNRQRQGLFDNLPAEVARDVIGWIDQIQRERAVAAGEDVVPPGHTTH